MSQPQPEPHKYTDEVRAAMRAQGIPVEGDDAPQEQPPVEGMTRYHIAIEESVHHGIAKPAVLAAMLRAAADALDPPRRPGYRGGMPTGITFNTDPTARTEVR